MSAFRISKLIGLKKEELAGFIFFSITRGKMLTSDSVLCVTIDQLLHTDWVVAADTLRWLELDQTCWSISGKIARRPFSI